MTKKIYDHLKITLKTVERQDPSTLSFLSQETIIAITHFLTTCCLELEISGIDLIFSGEEPMLQETHRFDEMCTLFKEALNPLVTLIFILKTAGTVFSDTWIDLIEKHDVHVEVTLNGIGQFQNICQKNYSSYDEIEKNIQNFNANTALGKINPITISHIVDLSEDPVEIYNYLRQNLKAHSMDFLLPHHTQDTFSQDPLLYGEFLCDLFDVWTEENNPTVRVSIFNQTIEYLKMSFETSNSFLTNEISTTSYNHKPYPKRKYREFTISSTGALKSPDALRQASSCWTWGNENVKNTSLSEYLQSPLSKNLYDSAQILPNPCQGCCRKKICRGGSMINRYSQETGFDNPTVYCVGLKLFFTHVANHLTHREYCLSKPGLL
ncbi:MAG: hypothetical protein V4489_10160 [Chlamydiota bacterium]